MSLNTNGFLDKYTEEVKNQAWFETEEQRLHEALTIPHQKIRAIEEEYGVKDLENKLKDVYVSKRDNKHIREYYYFRAIIDGIYNIVKDCGWQYCNEILDYAQRHYGMKFYSEEPFDICYRDYICELTPATYLQTEFIDLDFTYVIYRDYDADVCIKIPIDLNIEKTLTGIKNYAEAYVEEVTNQEKDKEWQMYLKLKEKYEGKEQ
jgi:hypothetical protein